MQPISNKDAGSSPSLGWIMAISRSLARASAPSPGSGARRYAAAAGCGEERSAPASGKMGTLRRAVSIGRRQPNNMSDSRRRWAAAQGSSSPIASSSCSSRVRAAPRSTRGRGGRCRAAGRRRRARRGPSARRPARSAPRGRRDWRRPSARARGFSGGRDLRQSERRAGATDRRILVDLLGRAGRRGWRALPRSRLRRSAPARAGNRLGMVEGHLDDLPEDGRRPGASPSASTCSPMSTSGSTSASRCCASPSIGSWERIWSRVRVSWPSVRADERSATGWPWNSA